MDTADISIRTIKHNNRGVGRSKKHVKYYDKTSLFSLQAINYFGKAVKLGRETESDDLATFLVNLGMSKIKRGLKVYKKKI